MSRAYYNEIDPYAAEWLRNLIAKGLIAPGEVDERSIEDVPPSYLSQFTQCHFFAGIGVWSYALRQAGWPDDRPVWTGSCPCQPFSAAGKGGGFTDERHLWPAFHYLIQECRPPIVFGEQVASKDADSWIDLVQTDLEALGYAVGAVPFPSAGVGAPHIRDRLYWVADSSERGSRACGTTSQHGAQRADWGSGSGQSMWLGNADDAGLEGFGSGHKTEGGRVGEVRPVTPASQSRGMGDTNGAGCPPCDSFALGVESRSRESQNPSGNGRAGPVNGGWSDADWLFCRDGKWRPVEPGTFPLANGASARVGRLRAYGNAVNAQQAQVFIAAYLDETDK